MGAGTAKPRKLKTTFRVAEDPQQAVIVGLPLVAAVAAIYLFSTLEPTEAGIAVLILAMIVVIPLFGKSRDRRMRAREERLRRSGTPGTARVATVENTNTETTNGWVVRCELEVSGTGPADGLRVVKLDGGQVLDLEPGAELPIYVDPGDPDFAFVDWRGGGRTEALGRG